MVATDRPTHMFREQLDQLAQRFRGRVTKLTIIICPLLGCKSTGIPGSSSTLMDLAQARYDVQCDLLLLTDKGTQIDVLLAHSASTSSGR